MHSVTLCNLIEDRDTKSLRLAQSEGTIVFESAYAKKRLTALHFPDKSVYLITRFFPVCKNEIAIRAVLTQKFSNESSIMLGLSQMSSSVKYESIADKLCTFSEVSL